MDGGEREGGNLAENWEGKSSEEGTTVGAAPECKEGTTGWREWRLWLSLGCIVWLDMLIGYWRLAR